MRIIGKKAMPEQQAGGKTVALLGGAFDPPHQGHVAMVRALLGAKDVDQVWILPVYHHPFTKPMGPFSHRLAMARLAFAGLSPCVRVRPIEQHLTGTSYTVRLLRYLTRLYSRTRFLLVMGADSYRGRAQWKDFDKIQQMAALIVFDRGKRSEIPDVSSTEARQRAQKGQALTGLIPKAVADYIKKKGLYKNT